ncbi:MAG: hypothetical protein IAE94_00690 [Chthoniobacterales bacterium]|nr:hypothetical protein [Chthoniobacterales bacterium]
MRDGYDYSSANLLSVQRGASVLGAICFASDGGNVHCSLDRIQDARVEASDWRLRLQCHGTVKVADVPSEFSTGQVIALELGDGVLARVRIPWCVFGDASPRWEAVRSEAGGGLDLVLHSGPPQTFLFDKAFSCGIGVVLSLDADADISQVTARTDGCRLRLSWPLHGNARLRCESPLTALREEDITAFARSLKSASTQETSSA